MFTDTNNFYLRIYKRPPSPQSPPPPPKKAALGILEMSPIIGIRFAINFRFIIIFIVSENMRK